MDFSRYLDSSVDNLGGYRNWLYRFPNGHTASVIVDANRHRPFRFEILHVDPEVEQDRTMAGLTSEEVEAKLAEIAALPSGAVFNR